MRSRYLQTLYSFWLSELSALNRLQLCSHPVRSLLDQGKKTIPQVCILSGGITAHLSDKTILNMSPLVKLQRWNSRYICSKSDGRLTHSHCSIILLSLSCPLPARKDSRTQQRVILLPFLSQGAFPQRTATIFEGSCLVVVPLSLRW